LNSASGAEPTSLRRGRFTGSGRPESPFLARSRAEAPSPLGSVDLSQYAFLRNDNDFLRNIVSQNLVEKATLVDTINDLKKEKADLVAQVAGLQEQLETCLEEREVARATMVRLQQDFNNAYGAQASDFVPFRSASGATLAANNPFGVIGSGTGRSRPETPAETPQRSPIVQPGNPTTNGNVHHPITNGYRPFGLDGNASPAETNRHRRSRFN
jgi:hypothetical protein